MKAIDARALGVHLETIMVRSTSAYRGAHHVHQSQDPEAVRVQTRAIRKALDEIEEAVGVAHEFLSAIEIDAGLVREDGSRVDD
jgi:hypothetical protein